MNDHINTSHINRDPFAERILSNEGIDWTAPMIDLIDALAEGYIIEMDKIGPTLDDAEAVNAAAQEWAIRTAEMFAR
jgi:hypothetical protein